MALVGNVRAGGHARWAAALAAPLAAMLVLAGCSSGSGAGGAPAAASSAAAPSAASSAAPSAAASSAAGASSAASPSSAAHGTVISTTKGPDGTYLVASGKAVYLWVHDTSSTSTCSGACAAAWPPVTTKGAPTASGSAVASKLGTTKRSDGTEEVTYSGHPLYYYAGDSAAGQTSGQGSDGFGAKWWLVAPSGSAITSSGSAAGTGAATTTSAAKGASWS